MTLKNTVLTRLRPLSLCLLMSACGLPPGIEQPEQTPEDTAAEEGSLSAEALTSASSTRTPVAVTRLREAVDGLLFMSESDYPFEVLLWRKPGGKPEAATVAALAGEDAGAPVEVRKLDDFFRGATTAQPEYGPDELAVVERYKKLVALIKKELSHVRVFRYGRIQIHAYVVGVTRSGDWIALSTTQIET